MGIFKKKQGVEHVLLFESRLYQSRVLISRKLVGRNICVAQMYIRKVYQRQSGIASSLDGMSTSGEDKVESLRAANAEIWSCYEKTHSQTRNIVMECGCDGVLWV